MNFSIFFLNKIKKENKLYTYFRVGGGGVFLYSNKPNIKNIEIYNFIKTTFIYIFKVNIFHIQKQLQINEVILLNFYNIQIFS